MATGSLGEEGAGDENADDDAGLCYENYSYHSI